MRGSSSYLFTCCSLLLALTHALPNASPDPSADPSSLDASRSPTNASVLDRDINPNLGINCQGSFYCDNSQAPFALHDFVYALTEGAMDGWVKGGPLPDHEIFREGQQVACALFFGRKDGVCVFLQGNIPDAGVEGREIKDLITLLWQHPCQQCGSIPVAMLQGKNDPELQGILTSNYVSQPGCTGVCYYPDN